MKKHVLITGSNRSGTTWVGETLRLVRDRNYIYEPFRSLTHLKVDSPIKHHFHYVTKDESDEFIKYINCCLSCQNRSLRKDLKAAKNMLDYVKAPSRQAKQFLMQWNFNDNFIIKDPLALFSAEWFKKHYSIDVIVLSRHPAAYVNSIVRMGWRHNIRLVLEQQEFVLRHLPQYLISKLEKFSQTDNNILQEATLRWEVYQTVINNYIKEKKEFLFYRHEDLSDDVVGCFRKLFTEIGSKFSEHIKREIEESNLKDGVLLDGKTVHILKRNSRENIKMWKRKLSEHDIDYIRNETYMQADVLYVDKDW